MECHTNPDPLPRLARGVYIMPFLGENGEIVYASVRHDGRRVAERLMGSDEREEDVIAELEQTLNRLDPPKFLKIA